MTKSSQKVWISNESDMATLTNKTDLMVSGWGWLTPLGHDLSQVLNAVNLHLITNKEADKHLPRKMTDWEMATVGIGSVRQGSCHGDSGGPLVAWINNLPLLVGVVSWGRPDCPGNNTNSPSVFVKVASFYDWIHQYVPKFGKLSMQKPSESNICNNVNFTYTINNLPSVASVKWSANNNITLVSGQGSATGTFKASSSTPALIKAEFEYLGRKHTLQYNDIWVGPPTIPVKLTARTGEQTFMADMVYQFEVKEQQDATEFLWYPNSGTITKTELGTRRISVLMPTPPRPGFHGVFDMYIATKNKCGTSKLYWAEIMGTIKDGNPGGIGIIPKPIDPFSLKSSSAPTSDIRIYSFNTGSLVYQEKDAVEFSIENTTLKPGIYVIESTDSEGTVTKTKVMKK